MRVLLVGPRGHGGEEVYVRTLQAHPAAGVEYVAAGDFHAGAAGAPCRVLEEVALNRLLRPWCLPDIGFRSLRLRDRFDLVHVHAHPARLPGLGPTPLVMSEGSSPVVYLQHYLGWSDVRLAAALARSRRAYRALGIHDRLLNLDRVRRAYVFSRWARELNLRWGADPDKLDVVYPGFATPPEVRREGRDTFTFLFVGTDFERKGGYEVVEAFDRIGSGWPQARLLIAGSDPRRPDPDRRLHSWVDAPRRERVLARLEAWVAAGRAERHPPQERASLYAAFYPRADAFVMPSHAEGFGFTNVEAMSFGLPVVSSRAGAIPEVVPDGVAGILVPPGEPEALAQAMDALLRDRARAQALGRAARARFLERFTLERFRAELGRVYRAALEG